MILALNRVSKTYSNGVKALDDITLELGRGLYGLLGPNGAGKSTLMRTIATLQKPDSGALLFKGADVFENPLSLRKVLGYLPQAFGVYPKISAEDLLDYFAALKGISSRKERLKAVQDVLGITNLSEYGKRYVADFSGGMKQRFGIAQLLLNNPELIIVDEPTAGLDPSERNRFLQLLLAIGSESTVIFSTHIVEDVKDICKELMVIDQGKILFKDTPAHALQFLTGKVWSAVMEKDEAARYDIISSAYGPENKTSVRVYSEKNPGPAFTPAAPSLEDAYFARLYKYWT